MADTRVGEKDVYLTGEASPDYPHDETRKERIASIAHDRGAQMGEAADVYGDIETAEEYGYVSRG